MIGAVLGGNPAVAQERLSAFGRASQLVDGRIKMMCVGSARIVASPPGILDDVAKTASLGRPQSGSREGIAGDFARIAANDGGELVLSRGDFGGRPLYYAVDASLGGVLASSQVTPLVAALGTTTLDIERLGARLLGKVHRDVSRTYHRQICRVPAASELRITVDGACSRQDIPFDSTPTTDDSIDELATEIRRLIRAAVSRIIAETEDVGVIVSGGLDSSSLLAMTVDIARAARAGGGQRVRALNLSFAGPGDDRPHLAAVCDALGIAPERIAPSEAASVLPISFVADSAPLGWPMSAFDVRLTQMGRDQGTKVLLTGGGGDHVFNGDFHTFADRIRRGHLVSALYSAATLRASTMHSVRSRLRTLVVAPLVKSATPSSVRRAAERMRGAVPWAGPTLRRMAAAGAFEEGSPARTLTGNWLRDLSRSALFLEFSESRAQVELLGGCERVEPYFDRQLISLIASIEPQLLFHGGWVRGLFRHALRGVIPDTVRMRPDKARFEPALIELVQAGGGFARLDPLVKMGALADLGLVDARAFRLRFEQLVRCPSNGRLWVELWPVLAAEAFARTF